MIERRPDWEIKLFAIVEEARDIPFKWGVQDCCCFSGRCVEAMTGQNPMTNFLGKYCDRAGATITLKKKGQGSLYLTLQAIFGKAVEPCFAKRGDLVFRIERGGPSVGICLGKFSAFVGREGDAEGLVFIPTLENLRAFRV